MSPFPATRRNGVCTGSLWKSHSRVRGSSSTSPVNSSSPATVPGVDSPDPAVSLDGILAEANERQRAHEFCVLVGNTMWSYSDVWAYAKGDPPTVSRFILLILALASYGDSRLTHSHDFPLFLVRNSDCRSICLEPTYERLDCSSQAIIVAIYGIYKSEQRRI